MAVELLSVAETMDYLNVNERWVRRAVADRRLPYVKLGGLLRFRRADLDAYIEARTVEAAS